MKHNHVFWTLILACCAGVVAVLLLAGQGKDPDFVPQALTAPQNGRDSAQDDSPKASEPRRFEAAATDEGRSPSDQDGDVSESPAPSEDPAPAALARSGSSAGIALRLLRDAGFDVPDITDLDASQVERLEQTYSDSRARLESVGMDRMMKLHTLTKEKFERGECERYTFDVQEREAGASYEWEADPEVGHAVRKIGFDAATGMGVARVVRVFPGDFAQIDSLDETEDRLLDERQRKLLQIIGR